MPRLLPLAALAAMLSISAIQPAAAGDPLCIENCANDSYLTAREVRSQSCERLWEIRNMIFSANRYCFSTARARRVFTNEGCLHRSVEEVPLNAFERANVALIRDVERAKGCR